MNYGWEEYIKQMALESTKYNKFLAILAESIKTWKHLAYFFQVSVHAHPILVIPCKRRWDTVLVPKFIVK